MTIPANIVFRWLDNRFALDWVHKNIAAFGGDPAKVTIFGESAGAEIVDALITQPPNPLTFCAAIMESGTATYRGAPANYSTSWNTLVTAMNCSSAKDVLACMRALPAATIKSYNELNRLSFVPVFDNVTSAYAAKSNRLNSTPKNSKIARVPILGGSNANEGRLYSVSANDSSSFVRGLFPTATDQQISDLLAAYPLNGPPGSGVYIGTFTSPLEQLGAFYGDFVFQCPARRVHLETSRVGIPSWRYYYNASFPSRCLHFVTCACCLIRILIQRSDTDLFPDAGVYHSSEIGIVLGTYPKANVTVFQEALSRYVQHIWANFAKDPNNFKAWPQGANATGVLGGGVRAEDGPQGSGPYMTVLNRTQTDLLDRRCSLFDEIYDALGH